MTVMTRDDSVATPATGDTVSGTGWEIRFLDLDVVDVIAEVDAILCEAVKPHRRPPGPSADGCAVQRLRRAPAAVGWPVVRCTSPLVARARPSFAPSNAALRPGTNPSRVLKGR
jgi:hypothetical protein